MRTGVHRLLMIALLATGMSLSGCARFSVKTGKAVSSVDGLERGTTTRQDVLDRYGPPQVSDDTTRSALIGENHLAYEERTARGWYIYLYYVSFFSSEESANTTVFLFDKAGTLVDYATTQAPVGRRFAWSIFSLIGSGMLIK